MNAIFREVKEAVERISGCRIYRHSLPHGADLFLDIERRFGRNGVKVVFDVGANAGQSAINYLREFPRAEIYSFEPVAKTYQKLVAATGKLPRVHTYNLGMGPKPGEVVINVNPIDLMSSIKLRRPEDHSETIVLETIAGIAEKCHIERIDFLKIDTEGYDLEVLSGAVPLLKEQRIHFIQCECEPVVRTKSFVDLAAIAGFLSEFGYRLLGLYEQQPAWDGSNTLFFLNALFVCEKLIVPGAKLPNIA